MGNLILGIVLAVIIISLLLIITIICSTISVYGNIFLNKEKRRKIEIFLNRDDIFWQNIYGTEYLSPIYGTDFIARTDLPFCYYFKYNESIKSYKSHNIFIPFFYKDIIKKINNFLNDDILTQSDKNLLFERYMNKLRGKKEKRVRNII